MDIPKRLILLQELDRLFDDFIAEHDVACRKTCAICCTCNVTLTTLEGLLIIDQIDSDQQAQLFAKMQKAADQPRFQPTTSINQIAQMCMQGTELPDESADPALGSCPLLEMDTCPIYTARPFACRSMLSTELCRPGGQARISDFILTVGQVFLQYLEAIDIPGYSGNLIDILTFLSEPRHVQAYESGQINAPPAGLTPNQQLPVLMIPPEHRERITPLMQKIQLAIRQSQQD